MQYTVTCRCTRPMRQEPGRRAGYMQCSCGNRVRLDDHLLSDRCQGVTDEGECCPRDVVMRRPVALCQGHIVKLSNTAEFAALPLHYGKVQTWLEKYDQEHVQQQQERGLVRRRMAHEEELRQAKLAEQSTIYYIVVRDCIKIGFTTNMQARMGGLMPDAILATEPGDLALEKRRHRQFAHLKAPLGREYFSVHPELLIHVEAVLAEHGPPATTGYPSYADWHLGENVLLPIKDAAKLAQIPIRTVYQWVQEERLTVTRPAGSARGTLVNFEEIEQLVKLRKAGKLPRVDRAG